MFSVGIENIGGNFKTLYSDSNDNGRHMLGDTSEASCRDFSDNSSHTIGDNREHICDIILHTRATILYFSVIL